MTVCDNCIHDEVCGIEGHLDEALIFCDNKAADVQPVRCGKWINDGDCLICSCCKTAYNSWFTGSNYCAECGADMRGEDKWLSIGRN